MKGKNLMTAVYSRISYLILTVFAVLFRIFQPGLLSTVFLFTVIFYILIFEISIRLMHKNVNNILRNTVAMLDLTSLKRLENFPIPILVCDKKKNVLWFSESFCSVFGEEFTSNLNTVDAINYDILKYSTLEVSVNGKDFRTYNDCCVLNGTELFVIYFFDCTDYVNLKQAFEKSKPVVAYILVDNYAELFRNIRESDRSVAMAKIDDAISTWVQPSNGIIKKLDNNRYISIFEAQYLNTFISDKFSILDTVRQLNLSTELPPTLSIGVGHDRSGLSENERAAREALDMALSRGGDQVAISSNTAGFEFFGGYAKLNDSRAKIKSRVTATKFDELLDGVDTVLIMGHQYSDMDSVGACVGVAAISMSRNKKTHIILNEDTCLADTLYDRLKSFDKYAGVFISKEDALMSAGLSAMVVIVDTHRASYAEMPELLEHAKEIIVIDHHRKSADFIQNTALFFHEPYASSACEMVTELVEYIEGCTITSFEAEALLAGIYLDTKSFSVKTGACTFDAASYLRSKGANTANVKQMFQTDMTTYKTRASIVRDAEIYRDIFAISLCDNDLEGNLKIATSQAADEMLNIENVRASFTLFEMKTGAINISARSFGSVNVQLIMEKLGGGGHQSMAGVQLDNIHIKEAYVKLTNAIDAYLEEQRTPQSLL